MSEFCEWCRKEVNHTTPIILTINLIQTGTRFDVCDKCLEMFEEKKRKWEIQNEEEEV